MSVEVMTESPRTGTRPATAIAAGESRVLMREVGWEGYEHLLEMVGDRRSPRLAYLNGDVELMSPGHEHESLGERLGLLVPLIVMGLRYPLPAGGPDDVPPPRPGPGDRGGQDVLPGQRGQHPRQEED